MEASVWWTAILNKREIRQCEHAENYLKNFKDAGVPGSGQFILLGMLVRLLELSFLAMDERTKQGVLDQWVLENGTVYPEV